MSKTSQQELLTEEQRQDLGAELIMWRLRVGRKQKDVARELGLSRWTISRIEHDAREVNIATAYKVYAFLVRELRKETQAALKIDEYAVDRDIELGKLRYDAKLANDPNDWQVNK